jgi:predicted metal-dependent hydrolase
MNAKAVSTRRAKRPRWYDADELKAAAREWAAKIGVKTPQIHVRPMARKWASISTAGRLTLNSDILDISRELGEFIIVHELVHLLAPNHGKVFKSFLHAYLPDWEEREEKLRTYLP